MNGKLTQDTFIVIPEISRGDISMHNQKGRPCEPPIMPE